MNPDLLHFKLDLESHGWPHTSGQDNATNEVAFYLLWPRLFDSGNKDIDVFDLEHEILFLRYFRVLDRNIFAKCEDVLLK